MLSKEEIEICKEAAKNYIESVKKYDNVGWLRGLLWYIEQSETKIKELNKGQHSLMQSRRKWKNRYYKERAKTKDLQKSVEQIYDDYQDIGKMAFDYSDKIEQLESDKQKTIEKLEKALSEMQDIDLTSYDRRKNNQRKVQNVYNILFDLKDKLKK